MQDINQAHAFLLLGLPDVIVRQVYEGQEMTLAEGELSLECVTLPIPPEIGHQTANPFAPAETPETHDLWLILKVGDFEHTLVPGNYLTSKAPPGGDGGPTYTITEGGIPNARLDVVLAAPRNAGELEDLSTFEGLLRQYGSVHPEETALTGVVAPTLTNDPSPKYDSKSSAYVHDEKKPLPPPVVHGAAGQDLRGRLVLVDETTGQVLGELDGKPTAEGAEALASSDPTRPVFVDLEPGADGYVAQTEVSTIPIEELDDWLLRGADRVSRGILSFGTWGSAKMLQGASKINQKVTPRPEPIKLGNTTNSGLKHLHGISGSAQTITRTTVDGINNALFRVTGSGSSKTTTGTTTAAPTVTTSGTATPSKKQGYYAMLKSGATQLVSAARSAGGSTSAPTSATATTAPTLPARAGEKQPPSYTQADQFPEKTAAYGAIQATSTGVASPTAASAKGSQYAAPAGTPPPGASPFTPGTQTPRKKRSLMNRSIIAIDAVLTATETAANRLVESGTAAASSAVGHKYGEDAAQATALVGGTVRNVVLVYIDIRGVGRRSLLKRVTKGYVKARMRNGETVRIQSQQATGPRTSVVDHQLVVSVPDAEKKK